MTAKKRLCSICSYILVICFTLLLSVPAFALGGECGEGITWDLVGGVLTISGKGDMKDYTEEEQAPWNEMKDEIKRIVVGEGIVSVGNYAFSGLKKAVSVSLPSTLREIGSRSFRECSSLRTIAFPQNLSLIDAAAFESCSSLDGIRFPSSLGTIRDHAFYRCESLTSVTVPETVFYLGRVVFAYCKSLSQARILCPLTSLPDSTFYACNALVNVVLPDTLNNIGQHAFYNCAELSSVYYKGNDAETLFQKIMASDDNVGSYLEIKNEDYDGKAVTSVSPTEDNTIYSYTENTDNSSVNLNVDEKYIFEADGEIVDLDDLPSYVEPGKEPYVDPSLDPDNEDPDQDGEYITSPVDSVTVKTDSKAEITATVENSEGFNEVIETINDAAKKYEQLTVYIGLTNTEVRGENLSGIAGKEVHITTSDGTEWIIPAENTKEDYSKEKYDLGTVVTPVSKIPEPIPSETVFKVKFNDNTDFNATVGMYVGHATQTATLYQKKGRNYNKIQSSMIDNNGIAWFNLASTDKKSDYFIAIDAQGIEKDEVIIPKSMHNEYLISSDGSGLMDSSGVKYEITGRKSSFGISGGRFAIYVAAAMGAIILVVSIVMITMNKMNKIKMQYALDKPEGDGKDKKTDVEQTGPEEAPSEKKKSEKSKKEKKKKKSASGKDNEKAEDQSDSSDKNDDDSAEDEKKSDDGEGDEKND